MIWFLYFVFLTSEISPRTPAISPKATRLPVEKQWHREHKVSQSERLRIGWSSLPLWWLQGPTALKTEYSLISIFHVNGSFTKVAGIWPAESVLSAQRLTSWPSKAFICSFSSLIPLQIFRPLHLHSEPEWLTPKVRVSVIEKSMRKGPALLKWPIWICKLCIYRYGIEVMSYLSFFNVL